MDTCVLHPKKSAASVASGNQRWETLTATLDQAIGPVLVESSILPAEANAENATEEKAIKLRHQQLLQALGLEIGTVAADRTTLPIARTAETAAKREIRNA